MGYNRKFTDDRKWCNACKEWHLLGDFDDNRRNPSGRQDYCKSCQAKKIAKACEVVHAQAVQCPTCNELKGCLCCGVRQKTTRVRSNEPGNIYVIGNVEIGRYKIGVAKDVKRRLKALQTGSPVPLVLLAQKHVNNMYGEEQELHLKLKQFHVHGEWFQLSTEQAISVLE